MSNKLVFILVHLLSLYFAIEEYPLWFLALSFFLLLAGTIGHKINKYFYFIITLLVISIHLLNYRKILEPEAASTFLCLMVYLKFLGPSTPSDFKNNIILSFLPLSALSIFNLSLFYLIFILISFFILLSLLNTHESEKYHFSQNLRLRKNEFFIFSSLIIFLSFIIFILFPRIPSFMPSVSEAYQKGEIGYSKTLQNSQIGSLSSSSKIIFRAYMEPLSQELLYWRGRILNTTDGYNWRNSPIKKEELKFFDNNPLHYLIRFEKNLAGDYIFLDRPTNQQDPSLNYNLGNFYTNRKKLKKVYRAESSLEKPEDLSPDESYKALPKFIPKRLKEIIKLLPKDTSFNEKINFFRDYLKSEKFIYTLTPGLSPTLDSFLKNKMGFCTHYASFMAVFFRSIGYSTRIVSGFQGGTYNEIGKFYTIRSNDAHAWVEIYHDKKWRRFDPTSYIDIRRIELGGDEYISELENRFSFLNFINQNNNKNFFYRELYNLKQWAQNINARVSLFLDDFGSDEQKNYQKRWLHYLKSIKSTLYLFSFSVLFVISFILYLKNKKTEKEKLRLRFKRFLKKNYNFDLEDNMSLEEINISLREESVSKLIKLYESYLYQDLTHEDKKKVKTALINKL